VSERAGSVGRIFCQPADYELNIRAGWILDGSYKIDQSIRSLAHRLAIRAVDRHTVNENRAKICILCSALRSDVRAPAFRQEPRQDRIRHMKIKLESGLRAVFDHRLGCRELRECGHRN